MLIADSLPNKTPLSERMGLHQPGQVTWPEPLLGKTCAECREFVGHNVSPIRAELGYGRCQMAMKVGGLWSVQFKRDAIACGQFQPEVK